MKWLLFILGMSFCGLMKGQKARKLFMVKENDSILSVRDENNKVVIPAFKIRWNPENLKKEIQTELIIVQENFLDYKIYDRNGRFLFKPKIFDFSVEFSEGHIAFEENGKQGLANKEGKITIPAIYDFMGFLNHGVVQACKDCYYDRSKDSEHAPLIGGTWYWLDKNGNVLKKRDYYPKIANSEFYDLPFHYNPIEREIVDNLKLYLPEISKKLNLNPQKTSVELVYAPTNFTPYYHLKIYEKNSWGYSLNLDAQVFTQFSFDPKTKTYFGFYEESSLRKKNGEESLKITVHKQPLRKWLRNKKVTLY